MGLRSFLKSCSRLLRLAKKPSRSELWLSIKICFLGTAAIGGIGFIVLIISMALHGGTPTRT
jgi:protein translocase SEC61 complex gamma subunit